MDPRWDRAITDIVEDRQATRIRFRVRGRSMLPTLQPDDEVVVERVALDGLRPGDLVLVRNEGQSLLHRFLGVRHQGGRRFLLTGGDRQRRADPLCPEGALVGRAVAAFRGDQALRLSTGRWPAWRHRVRTALWKAGHQLRTVWPLLVALLLLAAAGSPAQASVTLVSFEVERTGDDVRVTWQTASEIDNMGFYVQRSEQEGEGYERVTDLIPGEGDIVGAFYEWIDGAAAAGQVYYYKLEDLSASGGSTFWGPVSTTGEPTPTPSPTPTDTPTATPTPTPTATSTPSPSPTSTPTPTASSSPSPTPSASPTLTPSGQPSATPSPVVTRPRPSSTNTPVQLSSTPRPSTVGPTNTPTMTPSPPLVALATPTFTLEPSSTPQPSPTATTMTIVAGPPAEEEPSSGEETVSEEELAEAKRRLTWSLIGIGGVILGIVLLIMLALVAFALYRWGFLRLE